MNSFYIRKGDKNIGPLTEDFLLNEIKSGNFLQTDLACQVGDSEWKPLGSLFSQGNSDIEIALNYLREGFSQWYYVEDGEDSGYYATQKQHIEAVEQAISKVESLQINSPEVLTALQDAKNAISISLQRKFTGNWIYLIGMSLFWAFGLYVFIFQGIYNNSFGIFMSLICFGSSIAYYPACLTKQYVINRKIFAGEKRIVQKAFAAATKISNQNSGLSLLFSLFLMFCIPPVVPFVTAWHFTKNYLID
jgi:hypothetical protein